MVGFLRMVVPCLTLFGFTKFLPAQISYFPISSAWLRGKSPCPGIINLPRRKSSATDRLPLG